MRDVPHRSKKTITAIFLLAGLLGGSYLVLKNQNPLKGFEPTSIKDDREVKIQSLLELLKLDPEDYKTHAELAKLYFALAVSQTGPASLDDYKNAEKHALAAIEIGKKHNAPKEFLTEQYLLLSKIYQALGDNAKALEYAELAAESDPTKTAPLKRKGQVFEVLGKNDKARLAYLKAMELDDKDPETYSLLANQEFKKGNKKAALEWLKMGVRRNPTNATAFRNLARGYVRVKDYDKAKEAYRRALALDPNNAALRYEYAKLLKKTGDNDGYLAELKRAYALDPKNPKIAAAMGDAELAAGNKKRALELYRDALKSDGKNAELRAKYNALYNELSATAGKGGSTAGKGDASSTATGPGTSGTAGPGSGSGDGSGNTGTGVGDKGEPGSGSGDKGSGHTSASGSEKNEGLETGKGSNKSESSGNTAKDIEAGKKAFAEKDYTGAEAYFKKALEKDPTNNDARFFLARTLDAQGKKDAAMAEYRRVLEKEPEHAKANYFLGRLYYQAQKYADAERHFKKSAATDGKFAPAQYSLGLAQEKQGKSTEALASYRKSAETDASLTQPHFNSAIILKKNKKYDEALAELGKAGGGAEVEYQKGEILLKQKKFEEAKAAFGKVLGEKPQHYEAAFNLALTYHKLKDPAGADRALAKVIREDSPADLHYTYGKLLEESGETAGAEKQYRTSVQKDPRYYKGWLNLGRVSALGGKFDQAENAYRQAAVLEPGSYEANFNLANTLFKQKKYQSAVEYFEAAKKQENTRDVVLPLATSYEESGQHEKAARTYADFLGENPKDRIALERLGYLYFRKIRNKEKALEQFNKLLKYYPDSDKAQEYKGMVQLIEKQKAE